jgi:hypothetical protein
MLCGAMTIYLALQLLARSCERPVRDSNESMALLLLHRRGFTTVPCRHGRRNVAVRCSDLRRRRPHHFTFHACPPKLYAKGGSIVSVASTSHKAMRNPLRGLSLSFPVIQPYLIPVIMPFISWLPLATLLVESALPRIGCPDFPLPKALCGGEQSSVLPDAGEYSGKLLKSQV